MTGDCFLPVSTSELFHFAEGLVFIFCSKASWTLLLGKDICVITYRCIWKLTSILQCDSAINDILYIVKMSFYVLLHRFIVWRHFTAWDFLSASFVLCTHCICWEEGSLAAVPFLVQKCPWCQFWKVEDNYQMLNTSLSISRKTQQLNKCFWILFVCLFFPFCHRRSMPFPEQDSDASTWRTKSRSEEMLQALGTYSSMDSFVMEGEKYCTSVAFFNPYCKVENL